MDMFQNKTLWPYEHPQEMGGTQQHPVIRKWILALKHLRKQAECILQDDEGKAICSNDFSDLQNKH